MLTTVENANILVFVQLEARQCFKTSVSHIVPETIMMDGWGLLGVLVSYHYIFFYMISNNCTFVPDSHFFK